MTWYEPGRSAYIQLISSYAACLVDSTSLCISTPPQVKCIHLSNGKYTDLLLGHWLWRWPWVGAGPLGWSGSAADWPVLASSGWQGWAWAGQMGKWGTGGAEWGETRQGSSTRLSSPPSQPLLPPGEQLQGSTRQAVAARVLLSLWSNDEAPSGPQLTSSKSQPLCRASLSRHDY